MKVLIMGAGSQGGPCASILVRDKDVEEIRLGDIDINRAEAVKNKVNSPKLSALKVDASNVQEIVRAAEGMDVIIDLVTPEFYFNVLKAASNANVHYVNTAWEEEYLEGYEEGIVPLEAKHQLFDDFYKKGLTAILGCGLSPGYTNVISRYYVDKLDTVESIKIRIAERNVSASSLEQITRAWKPFWDPKQAMLDYALPCCVFRNGKIETLTEPFQGMEEYEFPEPIGKMPVSFHAHEEPFSLPNTFVKKGLKYSDFKYYVDAQVAPLINIGLASEEEIDVKGVKIKPIDVVLSLVESPGDAFFNEDPSKFELLDETIHLSVVLEIIGEKDGKTIEYTIHVPTFDKPRRKMYETYGTSMVYVALPAVIGARMAVEGTEKGIIATHELDPNKFIELMKASGYENTWEEKKEIKNG